MIQPLDVAVFRPFKTVLKEKMETYMIEKCLTSFSKKDSITIALNSWVNATVKSKSNIKSGFEASGIWPMSFLAMLQRWRLYHHGGIDTPSAVSPTWFVTREHMWTEILTLPKPIDHSPKRRKTLDATNRLLTCEDLDKYDS